MSVSGFESNEKIRTTFSLVMVFLINKGFDRGEQKGINP